MRDAFALLYWFSDFFLNLDFSRIFSIYHQPRREAISSEAVIGRGLAFCVLMSLKRPARLEHLTLPNSSCTV
jgi:hypothetical protein